MLILEKELEPETLAMLGEIRRADPAVPAELQQATARGFPAKLVAGAYLTRLGLEMVPFDCHLKFAPTLGALFCRYSGDALAEQLEIAFEHWHALAWSRR